MLSLRIVTDPANPNVTTQAKNNNLDQVVNEIFDDRTKFISTYGWDDNAFSAPREGTPNSQIPCRSLSASKRAAHPSRLKLTDPQ